jgi:hypothetical protein
MDKQKLFFGIIESYSDIWNIVQVDHDMILIIFYFSYYKLHFITYNTENFQFFKVR